MIKVLTNPNDSRYIFIVSDNNSAADHKHIAELEKHMNPYLQYTLLSTSKIPPTREIFLDKFQRDGKWIYWCSAGLWKEVCDFLRSLNVPFDASALNNAFKLTSFDLSIEQFTELVHSWNLNLEPRDYQIEAAWKILHYRLSLSELCTRSGKTLIFYMVARTAKELLGVKNILMIVPSVHLVKQGVADLKEYKEYFGIEQIWAGGEEVQCSDLTIGTFQSLIRKADKRYKGYDPGFFDKYDLVCVDEAHRTPCKSIKTILALDAFKNVKLRYGFTGTLPKPKTIEWMACQAILGPKIQEITARELIEEGFLADPIIQQHRIIYDSSTLTDSVIKCGEYLLSNYIKDENGKQVLLPKEQREMTMCHQKTLPTAMRIAKERLAPTEYERYIIDACAKSSKTLVLEQMMATFSQPKVELMDKLISEMDKNVIVFAHNVEYINYLHKHFSEQFPDRTTIKVSGSTSIKKRQAAIDAMMEDNNVIVVASFGVFGTGLTVKNVDYGIFAQSFKADTITRQSLGRLMLRTKDKTEFYLYDLIDVFPTKKLYKQGTAKIQIYKGEGHQHEIITHQKKFKTLTDI